ncbi:MAG: ribonuclease HII [Clostridia bacterium]|nr:ribonuclease HII [Clostridia bacterium]
MKPERFYALQQYERQLASSGIRIIAGVDEAGRGPLAGPVAAGCVIFKSDGPFPEADDSKKISEKKRDALYEEIIEKALAWGVGLADSQLIDEVNILQATQMAMKQAVDVACGKIGLTPEMVLIDHVRLPEFSYPQMPITHGDALSVTIASASIIAKVTRDRMMMEYAKQYPEYGFDKHKGYGTKAHYDAIATYGLTPIHRRSFLKKILQEGR